MNASTVLLKVILAVVADDGKTVQPCTTMGCIDFALKLHSQMNTSVNPCDDFYEYACGSFGKKMMLSDEIKMIDVRTDIHDKIKREISDLLEQPIEPDEPSPFVHAKTLYKSCLDRGATAAYSVVTLTRKLLDLGGWPILDGEYVWDERRFSWEQIIYKSRNSGLPFNMILDFNIKLSESSNTWNIEITRPALRLKRNYLKGGIENQFVKYYFEYMVDIAILLGANRAVAKKQLEDALKFEIKLAEISQTSYNIINGSISSIAAKYPKFPWLKYITEIAKPHNVQNSDQIFVEYPGYINHLMDLLAATKKRVIANYFLWTIVESSVKFLTDKFVYRRLSYLRKLNGYSGETDRWKICTDLIKRELNLAVAALYTKKMVKSNLREETLQYINDIRVQMKNILNVVPWMGKESKNRLINLINSTTVHINDDQLDINPIVDFYANLKFSRHEWYESILKIKLFYHEKQFSLLQNRVTGNPTLLNSTDVNVSYMYKTNVINVSPGLFQAYTVEKPAYLKYGTLAFLFGNQIARGVDDWLRQYQDENIKTDLEKTKQKYLEKIKCLTDQYSEYITKDDRLKTIGTKQVDKNIADYTGLKLARLAYEAYAKNNKNDYVPPSLENFSPDQLFWLSAASVTCAVYRKNIMTESNRFRMNAPLHNMKEFSEDFNCPPWSKMNYASKCDIWQTPKTCN